MAAEEEEDDYTIPLADRRVFGAGIKRKAISFVPATPLEVSLPTPTNSTSSIADRYLAIVSHDKDVDNGISRSEGQAADRVCAICNQPLIPANAVSAHESSIAHQVCLSHSHVPSHLPRDHVGVKYLTSYGWDPDSRSGLGARGEGIRIPIKAKEKNDTVGLRERVDEEENLREKKAARGSKENRVVVKMNAKEVRRKELETRKRADRLRASFYGNEDVDKYLGSAV